MAEFPLLPLPTPNLDTPPSGGRGGSKINFPSRARQTGKFGPIFGRLQAVLGRAQGAVELRDDPSSLAPERVIVFEIAGAVTDFLKAISRVPGLEFMAERDVDFEADDDFVLMQTKKGQEPRERRDKAVPGRLYLALPDVEALRQLVALWERWRKGHAMERGFAPFAHLFGQLRDLRPWGPQDRIPPDTIAFWQYERARHPERPVRTEIELWFRSGQRRRQSASNVVRALVTEAGGAILHESFIPEIAYHGLLADIPAQEIENLGALRAVRLALADEVMFFRPQSVLSDHQDVETTADTGPPRANEGLANEPIAALLDGMPVQAHSLLDGRVIIDDPDNLEGRTLVSRRIHGTAMASLIAHGDRNDAGTYLTRRIYVRPIMVTDPGFDEHTDRDRLLVDTIYQAILRIKGSEAEEPVAPTVFLVNLSLGDARRPFAGIMTPLARLLDYLAVKFNLLFLVSAGNIHLPLSVPGFNAWGEFEAATDDAKTRGILAGLHASKYERSILSPSESLNAVTVGAQHSDSVRERFGTRVSVDPFSDSTLPNVSCGLGLGYRRMIKPDVYFPGGREHVRLQSAGDGLKVATSPNGRLYGLSAASPDALNQGRLDQVALTSGTSAATALATRASHRIFDALLDREGGSLLADIDSAYYAVVVKALLVHTARWNGNDQLIKEICGPADLRRHVERAENSARFIGFGTPTITHAMECSASRATLVGFGSLLVDSAHTYRIPLPASLERVTDPRQLTVTIGWFSPVRPGHQNYRGARLEAAPVRKSLEVLGIERTKSQPADATVKRGTIYHERFDGDAAVPFVDDGHLALRVWCKEDSGIVEGVTIRYGIAVTIEAGTALPIYEEIQARLRVRPQL